MTCTNREAPTTPADQSKDHFVPERTTQFSEDGDEVWLDFRSLGWLLRGEGNPGPTGLCPVRELYIYIYIYTLFAYAATYVKPGRMLDLMS